MTISVFGNPIVEKDSLLVKFLPKLRKKFPQHIFIYQDPTEDLKIPKDEWVILDMAEGIGKITVFDTLEAFEKTKGLSVHDYDLITELKLISKVKKLPKLKIIAIPMSLKEKKITQDLIRLL